MSVREVTELRKKGMYKRACEQALAEMEENNTPWTCASMFWSLRDYTQKELLPAGKTEEAESCLEKMEALLCLMTDENGSGERACTSLHKMLQPGFGEMAVALGLSKTDPAAAYKTVAEKYGPSAAGLDEALHEDFGWILYRHVKAGREVMKSRETRALLRDYLELENPRPSLLHSAVLAFALAFAREHADFNFPAFLTLWNPEYFRDEDFRDAAEGELSAASLAGRVCRAVVRSGAKFDVAAFAGRSGSNGERFFECLRREWFWKLVNLHKEGKTAELLDAFDSYAADYSRLGPSRRHSEILSLARRWMTEENLRRFPAFMMRWDGEGNLFFTDWIKERDAEGNEYPCPAVKSAAKCFEALKNNTALRADRDILRWIASFHLRVMEKAADDDWTVLHYAKICVWDGRTEEAVSQYKKLLLTKGGRYYIWSELAACLGGPGGKNGDLCMGMLLKAGMLEKNEDFLGEIHLELASGWIARGFAGEALAELGAYARHRAEKGWHVSYEYGRLRDTAGRDAARRRAGVQEIRNLVRAAEDYAFSEMEWHNCVLTEKRTFEGAEYCSFFDGKSLCFTASVKRFPVLRNAAVGDVLAAKCLVAEKTENPARRSAGKKVAIPLLMRRTDAGDWAGIPVKYGIVDYVSAERNLIKIITAESKQIFHSFPGPFPGDVGLESFVRFLEFEKRSRDGIRTCAAGVRTCPRDEAVSRFKSCHVVADYVDKERQIFHVNSGTGVGGFVKFSLVPETPGVGDFFAVRYCVRQGKDGKESVKFFDVREEDGDTGNITRKIKGRLDVRFKKGPDWSAFLRGAPSAPPRPDYALVGDFVVAGNILERRGIRRDCDVTAFMVREDGWKWKVYDVEVVKDEK